jgi:Xaa-Pro aminopeptidase
MNIDTDAPPIASDIVRQHLDDAVARLSQADADALLIFRDTNILAFCGVPLAPSDRLVCGLLSREGQLAFIVPAFESGIACTLPAGSEVVAWEEEEDPYACVAQAAAKLGVQNGLILLDRHTWLGVQQRLERELPGARLTPDTELIDSIRMIKSPREVEIIRAACADTAKIYPLIAQKLRAGISELELRREVLAQLEKAGVTPYGDLIQGGETASIPHQRTGTRRFREGDAVIVDFSARKGSYLGDITRTFAVGEPQDEIKTAYRVVRAAQQAAIKVICPGVTCESVDAAARAIITDAGLGDYFVHRLGHGIGLDIHEPPYFVRGSRLRLEPGMCLTVEPGVYVPGQFGIRIEDDIVVTRDGCEILSRGVATDVCDSFDL